MLASSSGAKHHTPASSLLLPPQVSDRLPLDPEVLPLLRQPLQRRGHQEQPGHHGPRDQGAARPGPRRQEHGRHQKHVRRAERPALREAARRPRQLQGKASPSIFVFNHAKILNFCCCLYSSVCA